MILVNQEIRISDGHFRSKNCNTYKSEKDNFVEQKFNKFMAIAIAN